MKSTRIDIAPQVLSWLVNLDAGSQTFSGMYGNFKKWQTGEEKPTFRQIEEASKKTHIPLGYFFLKTPPIEQFPVLEYRTVDSASVKNPSRELVDTIHHMENIQAWMRDYLIESGNDSLMFVGSLKHERDVQKIVNAIRGYVGLDVQWQKNVRAGEDAFHYLRNKFEKIGVLILLNGIAGQNTHRALNIEEFRAFTLIDEYAPLVFINSKDSSGGKVFSLFHEISHIWLGENDFFNAGHAMYTSSHAAEAVCNKAAAELLAPDSVFPKEWEKYDDEILFNKTIKVARVFKCGETVIARRALEHRFINQQEYDEIAREAIRRFRLSKPNANSGGDYYRTNASRFGRPFVLALERSVREGKTLFSDAFRLTGTTRTTFDELVREIRGERV